MSLIGTREAGQMFGVSLTKIYEMVRGRHVPFIRYPGTHKILFDEEELGKFMERSIFPPVDMAGE